MTNPTSNFGWQMPTSTDLVTDLPADFEVFGQAVDTDFVDLLGGTTGQVLSKTSATDLDFTWVTANPGDITGVTAGTGISGGGTSGTVTVTNDMATTITAAGDIVVGTGSGTYDNLPIGTTAQVLTADTTVSPYKVKWATASAGGLTSIASGSFSGTSTLITGIPTTYKQLLLQIDAWFLSATGWGLYLRLNDDSTASRYYNSAAFATAGAAAFNAAKLELTMDNFGLTTSGYGSVTCYLPNYTSTTAYKQAIITGVGQGNSSNPSFFTYQANGGIYNQLTAITSLRINNGAGATQSGTYTLYGVS